MNNVPVGFCFLFHHIIPCVDFFFFEIVHQIERRARKMQNSCVVFLASGKNSFAKFRLRSFVRLVDDDKIPVDRKNFFVLGKFSADYFRAAHVLNRRKINKVIVGQSVFVGSANHFAERFFFIGVSAVLF